MKVFKFGGASVKKAEGVKNVLSVLKTTEEKNLIVIVSAMGKMTNLLEDLVLNYFSNPSEIKITISKFYEFHLKIITDLFNNNSHSIFNDLLKLKNESSSDVLSFSLSMRLILASSFSSSNFSRIANLSCFSFLSLSSFKKKVTFYLLMLTLKLVF